MTDTKSKPTPGEGNPDELPPADEKLATVRVQQIREARAAFQLWEGAIEELRSPKTQPMDRRSPEASWERLRLALAELAIKRHPDGWPSGDPKGRC